jgi:hypothetical protein
MEVSDWNRREGGKEVLHPAPARLNSVVARISSTAAQGGRSTNLLLSLTPVHFWRFTKASIVE